VPSKKNNFTLSGFSDKRMKGRKQMRYSLLRVANLQKGLVQLCLRPVQKDCLCWQARCWCHL
jgi:hypothetical protein